jgi:cytochrome b pre-mRNA-processing protein 3
MLGLLQKSKDRRDRVQALYQGLTVRARAPVFFAALEVSDSIDGRFDLLALHAFLVLERLKQAGLDGEAQGLMDAIFVGFDEAMRELGVSDMGLGRKMKTMANAFFGRLAAYETAADQAALRAALARNIWRGAPPAGAPERLAAYVETARAALAASDLAAGSLDFGPLP